MSHNFWATGYCVSTVGLDEERIGIRRQTGEAGIDTPRTLYELELPLQIRVETKEVQSARSSIIFPHAFGIQVRVQRLPVEPAASQDAVAVDVCNPVLGGLRRSRKATHQWIVWKGQHRIARIRTADVTADRTTGPERVLVVGEPEAILVTFLTR